MYFNYHFVFKNSFLVGKTIIWQSRKHASLEKYINLQLEDFYMLIDFIVSVWHLQWFGSVKRHPIWFVFMIKSLNALAGHMYRQFRFIHYSVYWRTVIHTHAELQTSNPHHVLHSEHWQMLRWKRGWPGWAKMGKQKKDDPSYWDTKDFEKGWINVGFYGLSGHFTTSTYIFYIYM